MVNSANTTGIKYASIEMMVRWAVTMYLVHGELAGDGTLKLPEGKASEMPVRSIHSLFCPVCL